MNKTTDPLNTVPPVTPCIFSPDRLYRYTLRREWLMEGGLHDQRYVMFIGLNPSTADETKDDPTIRRCKAFVASWGFGHMCMTNLFAWRDTDPKAMMKVKDPVGPENDQHLLQVAAGAALIIAAWGNHGDHLFRASKVRTLLKSYPIHAIRITHGIQPNHPLYLPANLKPILYRPATLPK